MHRWIRGEGEPEHANGKEDSTDHSDGQSELGFGHTVAFVLDEVCVVTSPQAAWRDGHDHADADTEDDRPTSCRLKPCLSKTMGNATKKR